MEHDISFNISDHLSKVMGHAFKDSACAKGFQSARTKTTALITHNLGPSAQQKVEIPSAKYLMSMTLSY